MLDEMDQVKRFLFDVKEAYDTDRHEWMFAKEDFRNQLELKENLLIECNMKLNQLLNVLRAMQLNEPIPSNVFGIGLAKELSLNEDSNTSSKNESLNNLVGGTANLLDFKFGNSRSALNNLQHRSMESSFEIVSNQPRINLSQLKSLNPQNDQNDFDEIQILDITKDRKELDVEFDQVFTFF